MVTLRVPRALSMKSSCGCLLALEAPTIVARDHRSTPRPSLEAL